MCINTTLFQLFNLVSQYKNLFKNYSIISGKNECYSLVIISSKIILYDTKITFKYFLTVVHP